MRKWRLFTSSIPQVLHVQYAYFILQPDFLIV